MKSRLITSLLLMLSIIPASAFRSINITTIDGSIFQLPIKKGMSTSFDDSNVVFSSDSKSISLAKDELVNWNFSKDLGDQTLWLTTEIEETNKQPAIKYNDGIIQLPNCNQEEGACIFDISGKLIKKVKATAEGLYIIETDIFEKGNYIVRTKAAVLKINVK